MKTAVANPDPLILADIVNAVARIAKPEKIVLFGSAARGTMGRHSDIDLLVIKKGRFKRRRLLTTIYANLPDTDIGVDIIVVTPAEVERYRDTPFLVICPALKDGKVVYGA
jgi:predicted nucleotidyltransferase